MNKLAQVIQDFLLNRIRNTCDEVALSKSDRDHYILDTAFLDDIDITELSLDLAGAVTVLVDPAEEAAS